MKNFDLTKYLAEGRLLKENKYDIDDPNSPLGQLNDNDQDVAILNNMTKKYGLDVVLMWMSSGEYGDREYFEEGKINENRPHPTEVFSDEELDYIGDMMTAMYDKLGLAAGEGETDVKKALALSDRIEGFFQSLN